ncbi:MAG: hypothetical protein KDE51_24790, partial [Anaerolineales bacterium]|nr:hypothetical protein [Anaerolineales bacterium]
MFTGREWVFQWLERTMAEQEGEAAPLVLYGERRIGKTAILKKLEAEPFDPKFVCVHVSAAELVKKADSWWWGLAKQCTDNLRGRGYTMPELNYTKFHKNELTSIHDYFLKPLLQAAGQKQLLLMIDDIHVLFDQEPWANFLKLWVQAIRQYQTLEVLMTAATTADDLYETFSAVTVRTKLLGVLEGTAATELLRKLLPALTYGEAERYILRITDNHPYYLWLLCGLLREHMYQQEILRPTVADVAAVARSQAYLRSNPPVHPDDVEPVLVTRLVSGEDVQSQAAAVPNTAVRAPLLIYGGGAVLLILLVLFLLPDSRNYILGDGGTEATAVALANTATALAVPPVSSTPTPTDTPTLTPSPTPTDTPTLTPSPTPTDTPT